MEIILMCPGAESGQSAFRAEMIEGIQAPERRYNILNGKITLAGQPDAVLHHDVDVLLKNPLYRMPTLQEQEAMFQEAQQTSTAQEQKENDMGDITILPPKVEQGDGPAPTDPDPNPDEPPAQDNGKKKNGGG